MKVGLAGAFGNLGAEILKVLVREGHEVIAADLKERPVEGTEGKYTFVSIDATEYVTMKGLCDGADVVITTMGLTGASTKFTSYDIDYQGNMNLYKVAQKAGVKKFNYISVISCDEPGAEKVPMLHAKYMVEQEIKKQPMDWVIYRPTGYFYDIIKVFRPMIEKGKVTLLGKTSGGGSCVVQLLSTAWGTVFQISSSRRMSFLKNGSFYDIDQGVDPDYFINDSSNFYNRKALTAYINGLF